jgi:hypothetical protein
MTVNSRLGILPNPLLNQTNNTLKVVTGYTLGIYLRRLTYLTWDRESVNIVGV